MAPAGARLYLNPSGDERFVASAQAAFANAVDPGGLQSALRGAYPRAVVQESMVSGPGLTWYAYRDGTWVDQAP